MVVVPVVCEEKAFCGTSPFLCHSLSDLHRDGREEEEGLLSGGRELPSVVEHLHKGSVQEMRT